MQFPSEFIVEEKKMFRSLEQRHLQSVATYLRTLPQVTKSPYVYLSTLYNDMTLILLMMKTMKNEEMALALIQSGDEMTLVLNCRCELAASPRRGALPTA